MPKKIHIAQQLELDLVSPYLNEPAVVADLREAAAVHAQLSQALTDRAALESRLAHEEVFRGEFTQEYERETQFLLGANLSDPRRRAILRLAKKNPSAFRKAVIAVKAKLKINL